MKIEEGGRGARSLRRGRLLGAALAALLGGGLLAPAGLAAQEGLEAVARAFAGGWASGSVERLAPHLAASGVRLQLEGASHGPLSSRQAAGALRDFLRDYQGGSAVVTRAAPAGGAGERGFAEIRWNSRIAGTSQELSRHLFLGMRLEEGRWRVDEVRLLR